MLAYAVSTALNPLLAGAWTLPWWIWGAFLGLAAGCNSRLLRRPRNLLAVILSNLPVLGFCALLAGVWLAQSGSWWPGVVVNLVEVACFWPVMIFLILKPPAEEEFTGYWETGLAAILASSVIHDSLTKTFALQLYLATLAYFLIGLARIAFEWTRADGSMAGNLKIALSLGVVMALVLSGAVAGTVLGLPGLKDFLMLSIFYLEHFLAVLKNLLIYFLNLLGLNQPPPSAGMPSFQMPVRPPAGDNLATGSAPLWLMVILWVMLGLASLLALLAIGITLYQWLQALRRARLALPPPERRSLPHPGFWRTFVGLCRRAWRYVFGIVKKWLRSLFSDPPSSIGELYFYFLQWGRKNRCPRRSWETPREYLERLTALGRQTGGCDSGLEDVLGRITADFMAVTYGRCRSRLSSREIKETAGFLKKARLPRAKRFNSWFKRIFTTKIP